MLSAGVETKDIQTPIDALKSAQDPRMQQWSQLIDLIRENAPPEQIKQAELQVAELFKNQPFILKQQLPLIEQMARRLDAIKAFQQFRLPGSDRIVMDRREQNMGEPKDAALRQAQDTALRQAQDAAKGTSAADKKVEIAKEAMERLRMLDGKLVKEKDRTYANYLGGRGLERGGMDKQVAEQRLEKLLSAFEKMVIARFEDGKKVAQDSPDGKPKFLEKSEAQWRDFFKAFLDRTVQKKTLMSEIREFLLRGLIPKGSKGIVIADMQLNGGRVEKFVRFSVLAEALAKLKTLNPGDAFGKGMLSELSGEELMFLALAVSRGREFAASMLPTQGKFVGGKAEAQAAAALGIPLEQQLRQKAQMLRGRKGGGFGGGLFGEGSGDEVPYQFIPWWRWGNLKRPGKFRWVTTVFYGTLLALALIGIGALTYRMLGG